MPAKTSKKTRTCYVCKTSFQGRRDAKTCSPACRKRMQRQLRSELIRKAERLESSLGQELHRITAALMKQHVWHEPMVLADERGSIAVVEPPTEDKAVDQQEASIDIQHDEEPARAPAEPLETSPQTESVPESPSGGSSIQSTALPREADKRFVPPMTDSSQPSSAPAEEIPAGPDPMANVMPGEAPAPLTTTDDSATAAPSTLHLEDMMSTETLEPSAAGQAEAMESADDEVPPAKSSGGGPFSLFRYNRIALMSTGLALLAIVVISLGSFFLLSRHNTKQEGPVSKSSPGSYAVGDLPLSKVPNNPSLGVGEANQVTINGELTVNESLVLAPSSTPTTPVAGQLYYDKATNEPYYYNGTQFISLAPQQQQPGVDSLGGAQGNIGVGNGLTINNNQLAISNLLQQQINNAASQSGGVLSLTGTANQVSVSSSTGNVTLSLPQSIAVTSTPTFVGLTVNGTLSVATVQQTTVGSNLNINAGNDNISFTAGGRTFIFPTSGPASQTICTTGITCASGGGQAVLLQPGSAQTDTGSGPSIFLNNTGGGGLLELQSSGVDRFVVDNSGNITTGGSYNGQTISSAANFTGTVAIQGANSLTLGTSSNVGSVIFRDGSSSFTGTLRLQGTLSGAATYNLPTATGTQTICTAEAGNCAGTGSGVTTPGGTVGALAYFSGTQQISSSILSQSASTLTAAGNLVVNTANGFTGNLINLEVNGSSKLTVDELGNSIQAGTLAVNGTGASSIAGSLSIGSGLTVTTGGATITGTTSITGSGTITGTLAVQGANALTLGTASANTGAIVFKGSGGNGTLTLQGPTTPDVGNYTLSLPAITSNDTVCTNSTRATACPNYAPASGSNNYIINSTTLQTADFNISGTGKAATLNATSAIQLNGANINTAGTLNNVAYLSQANTFTAAGTALTVNNNALIGGTLAVQGSGGLTLGVASATAGSLKFANATNSNLGILQAAAPSGTGNGTYTLPSLVGGTADEICLKTLGNCGGSGGGVTTPGGTAGTLAIFTGSQTIADSVITQSGSAISVAGTLSVTGSNSLSLGTSSANTGSLAFKNSTNGNTLTLQAGATASNLTFTLPTADGSNGHCLQTNGSGVLSFNSCTGGAAGGVTSLDGLTGVLTLNNSSGSGSAITIDNASTTQKGIAQFNATNFTASSGVINTAQNIDTGASPVFVSPNATTGVNTGPGVGTQRIDATGNLVNIGTVTTTGDINGQTISSSANFTGTVAVQGSGGLTLGVASTTAGILKLANATNSNLSLVTASAPSGSGNATYNLPSIAGGSSDDICLVTLGNCAGSGGGITGSGTNGTIAIFTGTGSIGNSTLTQSGSTVTASGNMVIQGANSLTLGTASANTGSLAFKNSTNANTLTLQSGATASNLTLTLPTADGSNGYCLQTNGSGVLSFNSCTGGAGGGVTSLDGLTGVLTLNNSSGSGSAITIDDASTTQKGIAQFNSTNFTASSGTINTAQNINTTATPTFGGLTLSSALTVPNGGTGAGSFTANGILYGNGTSALQATAAAANSVLVTNGSNVPSLSQTLPTAVQGNITSVGTLTSGFIGSGFGTISTGNNISTTATVQGGAGVFTGASSLAVGSASTNTGSIAFYNSAGTHTISLQGPSSDPAANYTLTIPTLTGNDTICVAALSNCAATGAAGGDLSGFYPNPNVAKLQGTTLTFSSLASGDVLQYNGSAIVNGHITNTNLTAGNFNAIQGTGNLTSGSIGSGFGAISTGSNISTTATLHGDTLTAGSSNQFQVDASGNLTIANTASILGSNGLTLGDAGTTDGVLAFANSTNTNLTVIQAAAPSGTGNANISIPSIGGGTSDEVCLKTLQNCVGSGGGVTTPGGTTGKLAYFTGSQTIADSIVSQSGTTLTVAGNQVVNAANGFTGNLLNLEVNSSSKLSVDQTGSTVQAGTLTVSGTGASSIAGSLTVSNTLTLSTLGSADTSTLLCRNSSNQVATCSGSGSGSPFVQGGNSFGATAVLGTNDNNNLNIRTNGSTVATITTAGQLQLSVQGSTGGLQIGGDASANLYRSATATLKTDGTLNVGTALQTNGTTRIDNVGNLSNIGTITAAATSTATSGTNFEGSIAYTANPSSAPGAQTDFQGLRITTSSASANTNSNTRLFGASTNTSFTGSGTLGTSYANYMQTSNAGSGTITTAYGGNGVILNSSNGNITTGTAIQGTINSTGTGTISSARALDANVINNGGGTLTSAYGLRVETPTNSGVGSTIGTAYGIYIGEQSAASTNYGLYFAGTAGTSIDGISWNGDTNLYRSAGATLKTDGTLNVVTGYQINGVAGANTTCSGGQFLQNQVVAGGITTGGTCVAASNGVTTIGAIDSQTKSANGAVISGTTLYLQTADASAPGLVSTGTQTFAGDKTFTGATTLSATGATSLAVTGVPALSATSSLIQIGSAITNGSANGTYIGINEPAAGAGSASDFLRFLTNGSLRLAVSNGGVVTANSTFYVSGTGAATAFKGNKTASNSFIQNFLLSSDTNPSFNINGDGAISWGAGGASATDTNLYRSAAATLKTDNSFAVGTDLNVTGTTTIGTLGTTNTSTLLCRNASNQIAGCSTTGSGAPFVQGGNSFAATAVLGTNDSNSLQVRTNGTTALTIDTSQNATFAGTISSPGAGSNSERFGLSASVSTFNGALAVGNGSSVTGNTGTALGTSATAGTAATAIGNGSSAAGNNSIALGSGASAANGASIAIGRGATTTATNQMVIGANSFAIQNVYIGNGVTNASPTGFTLQATGGSGSNIAGASVTVAGGQGTGTGNGGNINFQVAKPGSTGSSLNSLATVASFSGVNGAAFFQNSADSTTAFQVQNTGGTPLLVVDTVNNRVGIGAASPTTNLTVTGATGATIAIATTTNLNTDNAYLQVNNRARFGFANGAVLIDDNNASKALNINLYNGSATSTVLGFAATTGAATFKPTTGNDSTSAFRIQNAAASNTVLDVDTVNTRVGIGTTSPNTSLSVYNANSSTTQTDLTQALDKGGINIVTDYTDGAYTPGIFWSTQNNNSSKPKAGIYMYEDNANGTSLLFGTSNSYATGINNTALTLGPTGSAIFRNGSNSTVGFQVQDATGLSNYLTVNTSTGSVLTSKLFIDTLGSSGSTSLCLNGSNQVSTCTSGGVTTVGAIDSQTKSSNGAVISGSSIYLQTADASAPGLVSTGTQTFAGVKTFNSNVIHGGDVLGSSSATGTTGTSSGTGGTNVTTITLASAGSFANGDVIFVDNTGGSGQDYYTRITAGGGTTTLTVSPAVSYGTAAGYTGNATITKYNVQNIGAVTSTNDYTTQANRFFQGYFLGGVVTGAGSTTLSDARLASTVGMNFNSLSYIFQNTSNSTSALQIQNASAQTLLVADTTNQRVAIGPAAVTGNGVLTIGTNTTVASGGIYFGTDTNLYRMGNSDLATDSVFSVNNNLFSTGQISSELSTDNNTRIALNQSAGGANKAGLLFGDGNLTPDVNLYRDSAGVLKTDNALTVSGLLTGNAGATLSGGTINLNASSNNTTNINTGSSTGAINIGNTSSGAVTISAGSAGAKVQTTDSATAFQVLQNSTSSSLFTVDTLGSNITLLGNNSSATSSWTTTSALPQTREDQGGTIVNGYMYALGGTGAGSNTVTYYAKIKADGTLDTWGTTSSIAGQRDYVGVTSANGYVYAVGGQNGGTSQTSVYYAKTNADGTLGSWTATTSLPAARGAAGTFTANGYIYEVGGEATSGGAAQTTVYYAKLNPDGTIPAAGSGTWATTSALTGNARAHHTVAYANGYAYVVGGETGATAQTTVLYAKVNSDGTLGTWATTSALTQARQDQSTVVLNGYIYAIGGVNGSGVNQSTVLAAPLSYNGTVGTWSQISTSLPNVRIESVGLTANGYIYLVGGNDGSTTASVYYASTSRLKVGGSLDLVGFGGESLADPSAGGALTAGNTAIVGTLQVQGAANFSQAVSIAGTLSVGGDVAIRSATNSATAFQVQNSDASATLLAADTTNLVVTVAGTTSTFGNLTLTNAHFKSTQTNAPTIGTPTNCGTSPTAAVGTSSTDSAGAFRITAGTGSPTTCDTVFSFNKAYGAAPKSVIVVAESKDGGTGTAAARQIYVSNSATTTFTVKFNSSPAASEVNWFYYWVVE